MKTASQRKHEHPQMQRMLKKEKSLSIREERRMFIKEGT